MNTIQFISPHIDDAVLSCGGLIRNLCSSGFRVEVYSIFTQTNWTNAFAISGKMYGRDCNAIATLRKEEEASASQKLGYVAYCLDYIDFCIRGSLDERSELQLSKIIANHFRSILLRNSPCFFPGGQAHPDHAIIRNIGNTLMSEGYDIVFYEDQPYSSLGTSKGVLLSNAFSRAGFLPYIVWFVWEMKAEAILEYRSQVSHDWIRSIHNYSYDLSRNRFCERYWHSNLTFQLRSTVPFLEEGYV